MIAPIAALVLLIGSVLLWVAPTPVFTFPESIVVVCVLGGSIVATVLWLARSLPTGYTVLLVAGPSASTRLYRPLSRSLRSRPRAPTAVEEDADTRVHPVLGGAAFERAARLLCERGPDPDGEEDGQ